MEICDILAQERFGPRIASCMMPLIPLPFLQTFFNFPSWPTSVSLLPSHSKIQAMDAEYTAKIKVSHSQSPEVHLQAKSSSGQKVANQEYVLGGSCAGRTYSPMTLKGGLRQMQCVDASGQRVGQHHLRRSSVFGLRRWGRGCRPFVCVCSRWRQSLPPTVVAITWGISLYHSVCTVCCACQSMSNGRWGCFDVPPASPFPL